MLGIIKIIPVMVGEKGFTSIFVDAGADKMSYGFPEQQQDIFQAVEGATILDCLPEGLLTNRTDARVMYRRINIGDSVAYVVMGNDATFDQRYEDGQGSRWVETRNFKFGCIPDGCRDVTALRDVYTQSMNTADLEALVLSVQEVRITRQADYPALIGNGLSPSQAIAQAHVFQGVMLGSVRDNELPQLNLSGTNEQILPARFDESRRNLFKITGRILALFRHRETLAASIGKPPERSIPLAAVEGQIHKPA
jgi:hypothetical protein